MRCPVHYRRKHEKGSRGWGGDRPSCIWTASTKTTFYNNRKHKEVATRIYNDYLLKGREQEGGGGRLYKYTNRRLSRQSWKNGCRPPYTKNGRGLQEMDSVEGKEPLFTLRAPGLGLPFTTTRGKSYVETTVPEEWSRKLSKLPLGGKRHDDLEKRTS